MGTIADKLSYLNETKTQFREKLNKLGADISDNATFRSYLVYLDNLYNGLFNLTDMSKNGIIGRTSQDEEPTPSTPQEIKDLSGDITYSVGGNEPYVPKRDFTISLKSKNLLNLTNGTYTSNGITAVVNNGTITLNGTCTGSTSFILIPSNLDSLVGTYTLSANNTETIGSSSNYADIRIYKDSSHSYATFLHDLNSYHTYTLNLESGATFRIRTGVGLTYNNFIVKPQIELGSQATTYESYYDIHLDKIDTYEDKIYSKDNKFYLHKENDNIVLNGSESWGKSASTRIDRFFFNIELPSTSASQSTNTLKCTHFKIINNSAIYEVGTMFIGGANNSSAIFVDYTSYGTTTLADFKTWLETNKPIVYYVLNTQTTTEITSTLYPTLYNQLKEIQDYLIEYKSKYELILNYSEPNIEY